VVAVAVLRDGDDGWGEDGMRRVVYHLDFIRMIIIHDHTLTLPLSDLFGLFMNLAIHNGDVC